MPAVAPEKTIYGRCRAVPEIQTTETGQIVRFDLVQADTQKVIEILAWPSRTTALSLWLADLAAAPLIRVRGRFRLRRPGPAGQRDWRLLASAIEIGPRDSGADLIDAAKAYALDRASHPEGAPAERTERTLRVGRAILKPMQRHRDGFALAFQAYSTSDALIDIVYPVPNDADPGDLVALSGRLSRASRIILTGYFRPSVLRGNQIVRWGFVASGHSIEEPRPRKAAPSPTPEGDKPSRRPRKSKPAQPAPEPPSQKPPSQEPPLLDLSSAQRAALATVPLARALIQPTIRRSLDELGCKTLADVADLSPTRLGRQPGIGHRRVQLCRRAVQDGLIWMTRSRDRTAKRTSSNSGVSAEP